MSISKQAVFYAILVSSVAPLAAMAQSAATDASDSVTLKPIVITPLRRASAIERATSTVEIIEAEQIEKSAASDLPSLLKAQTGIAIKTSGGMGSTAGIYLRGMGPTQTLVLVNGVRTASPTSGTTALASIPLASIERIEIARGGHSAQYGSDAMGGVVNIITKSGGGCGDRNWCASLSSGVLYPWGAYLSGTMQGRTSEGIEYGFGASIIGTEGYDFTQPSTWGHDPDRDGFKLGAVNFSLGKDFDWGRLYADGLFSRGRNQFDMSFPEADQADTTNFAGKLGARVDHAEDWSTTLELSSGVDNSKNFRRNVSGADRYNTHRYGIYAATEKQFDTGALSNTISVGGEAYHEKADVTTAYASYAEGRDLAALFAQYSAEYAAFRLDSGVRYDHNQQFGDAVTYNIGGSYEIVDGLTLRSSYTTGFRAPTFNELYYPGFGNPELDPETTRSYEVGLKWQPAADTSFDLAFYQTRLRDAIASTEVSPGWYLPVNIANARVTGVEFNAAHRFDEKWAVRAGLDLKRPLNTDDDLDLPYRERVKATAELNFTPIDSLDLTARLIYGGSRFSDTANDKKLASYVTADFVASYAIDAQSKLKLSVENIFDKDYESTAGYIAPGRSFNLGLTRDF